MRYVYIGLGALMLLFAGVQYNDPDGLFWAIIYLIPALFAIAAAIRPAALGAGAGQAVLLATILAAAAAMVYYWPRTEQFWRIDVWWHTETAREGMGLMVCLIVLLVAWAGSRSAARRI